MGGFRRGNPAGCLLAVPSSRVLFDGRDALLQMGFTGRQQALTASAVFSV